MIFINNMNYLKKNIYMFLLSCNIYKIKKMFNKYSFITVYYHMLTLNNDKLINFNIKYFKIKINNLKC